MQIRMMISRPGHRARPTGEIVTVVPGLKLKSHFIAKIGNCRWPVGSIATVVRVTENRAFVRFEGATETFCTDFRKHAFDVVG